MTLFTYISRRLGLLFGGIALLFVMFAQPAFASEKPGLIDPPTTTGIDDFEGLEDAANHIISLWDAFEDDIDPDASLVFSITTNTNAALVTPAVDNSLGILTLDFAADQFGTADITVRATDTNTEFTETTFQVNITSVNDAPTFNLGTPPAVNEDVGAQTVTNLATSISAGPLNEAGQNVSFSVSNNTNPGIFSVQPSVSATGTLTYTPAANFSGTAVITLVATDDGGVANGGQNTSAPQDFTITINEVNDEPSFTKGNNINVNEDSGAFSQSNWASNIDAGPNEGSQGLTFNLSPTNTNLFSVQPSVSSTGTLSFTPALNAFGTSTITITLMDDGGTANGGDNESPAQTFTVTIDAVNDRPTTSGISNQVDLEDASNRQINLFSAFDDEEDADASLTYQELSNSNAGLFTSTSIDPGTGIYTLDYAPDANGSSDITIRVTDTQGEFVDETFTVTLTAVNDEPSFTKGADQVVNEDASFQTVNGWASNISAGPSNEVSQVLTFVVTPTNPDLFQAGPTISSTGTLTYQPAANASGASTVTVTLTDNGGTANGGDNESPSQTFTITINGQNDQPTSSPISDIQVLEDAAAPLITLFDHFEDVEDADNQLTYTIISNSNPSLFGAIPPISSTNGNLTLPLAPDEHGTADLTVRATDSGGLSADESFEVEVLPVNDAPSFTSGGNVIIPEDSEPYSEQWATNISPGPASEVNETVSFNVIVDDPTLFDIQPLIGPTGILSFTPKADISGESNITVTLVDNGGTANGGTDTSPEIEFTITISAENDPPIAVDDVYTVLEGSSLTATPGGSPPGVLDNDLDTDGDDLTAIIVQEPLHSSNYSLLPNGTLFYVHDGSENVTDSLTYIAFDGTENSNIAKVILNIKESNDPPVAIGIQDIISVEDAPLQLVDLFTAFSDPDDTPDALTYSVSNTTNPALFEDLIVNAETGKLELLYAENANGSSNVTVQATDPGGLSATTTFKVTLTPVNDPPMMIPGPDITLDEDPGPQNIAGWAQEVVAGPPDEVTQTITTSVIVSNPALFSQQPTLNINGTEGTLSFTPSPQTDGQSSVTITLTDNAGGNNTASYTFLITIQGDNDKPTSVTIADIEVNEDAPTTTINLYDYFDDVEDEDENLIFTLEGNFDESLFEVISIDGDPKILTINYKADAFGETLIGIRATDTGGLFAQEDVDIRIAPVNDAPSFTAGSDVTVAQNSSSYAEQWATDITLGPDNESAQEGFFTVNITNGTETLFADLPTISPEGVLSFTPAIGDQVFGDASISVILADNGGTENGGVSQSPAVNFTISIRRQNTAPAGNIDNYIVDQGQTLQVNAAAGVLANDTDPENDNLTAVLISGPANASSFTLNPDGSFTYRHNNTNSTNDSFVYVANDGFDNSNETTVAISIQPTGTLSLSTLVLQEDADDSFINVRAALSLPLTGYEFTVSNISNPTLFAEAEMDTLNGILRVAYAANQFGEGNINITVTPEEGDPVLATQKIAILPVNDDPIAVDDIAATIQDRPIEINVISNDVDFDNDNLIIFRITNPSDGRVAPQSNGNLLYTPDPNFTGIATFTYSIRDDSLAVSEGEVTVTVFAGRFVVSEMDITGSATSVAYNISNAGEVVGATMTSGGSVQAFSSNTELVFDSASEALDANDFGQVVGASVVDDQANTSPVFEATLWDTTGVSHLGSLDGRTSKAYSINNSAQIVGISSKESSDVLHAVAWENGVLAELESINNAESQAFDINEDGLVAGYAGNNAVLWRNGQVQDQLIGAAGRAYALNASGQSVGSIDDGTIKAMFWNSSGSPVALHPANSTFSEAYGINNATWVVGAYLPPSVGKKASKAIRKADLLKGSFAETSTAKAKDKKAGSAADEIQQINMDMRAFLWQGDDILDLNDFIDEASGWVLLEARAINNAAQITGIGLFNGERQAFLLSPTLNKTPTPATDIISITSLSPTTINVIENDVDVDGDTLQVVSVTQGEFGHVKRIDNQHVVYEPGPAFTGQDVFTYTVDDGQGGLATGTVEILLDASSLPNEVTLSQNYPNPFSSTTTISFGLPEQSEVILEVYNLLGQRIATLVDDVRAAGTYAIPFEANHLPGGVYIYRLRTQHFEQSKQLVVGY